MSLAVSGSDEYFQLGIEPTTKNRDNIDCVDSLTSIPIDLEDIMCISSGLSHSVILKGGDVFAAGDDTDFSIGSDSRQIYKGFTKIVICKEPIIWAACGKYFTLYLTFGGKVIYCTYESEKSQIIVNITKKAASVFGGYYGGIIDEEGSIYILDKSDPEIAPTKFSFSSPIVDLVCCVSFTCALANDGRVFANGKVNNDYEDFIEVPSLKGKNIEKISGWLDTCVALASDGNAFICGTNANGEFGDLTRISNYPTFTRIGLNANIVDVSCSTHTLLLTDEGNIYGCGRNDCYQMFFKSPTEVLLKLTLVKRTEAVQVFTGYNTSFVTSGIRKLINPAKKMFKKTDAHHELSEQIDSANAIIMRQWNHLKVLSNAGDILMKQNETNTDKICDIQRAQAIKVYELERQIELMNNKLDALVTILKYQKTFK